MTCEFLNEVVDEYLTFHQTRMPECKIPIPKRNSNMSEQMFLGNGNLFQEPYPPFLSFGDQNIVFFAQFIDMNLNYSTCALYQCYILAFSLNYMNLRYLGLQN